MSDKPIWQSKKFVIAAAVFVAALIMTLLPSVVEVDGETQATLFDLVPRVFVFGALWLIGHTVTDAMSLAVGVQGKTLQDAAHDLIDAVAGYNDDVAPPQEHIPVGPSEAVR